jgi:hypothetical protein
MCHLLHRRSICSWCLVLALLCVHCGHPAGVVVRETGTQSAALSSTVYTGDPSAAPQLVAGFFRIEDYSWRWTTQQFSVILPSSGGMGSGATLTVELSVPDVQIAHLGKMTLAASIGHEALSPETYTKPGRYTYKREVPASLLTNQEVRVDFHLDKAMEPAGQDQRRLGVIVSSIGLDPR